MQPMQDSASFQSNIVWLSLINDLNSLEDFTQQRNIDRFTELLTPEILATKTSSGENLLHILYKLNKEALKGLDDIADYLNKYPHITGLRIESLSKNNNQDRLIAIGKELRKRGIPSKRMVFVYFNQPKYISDTVHFHICTIENRLIKDTKLKIVKDKRRKNQ